MVLFLRTSLGRQLRQVSQLRCDDNCDRTDLSLVNGYESRFVDANYIAVLGFAEAVDWKNRSLAFHTGRMIAQSGYGLICGNTRSTFDYALHGASQEGGTTQVILEKGKHPDCAHCDNYYYVKGSAEKHRLLVKHARGAVVIGGGDRTKKLVSRLVQLNRPVAAIEGTGGVVRKELPGRVHRASTAKDGVAWVCSRLSF